MWAVEAPSSWFRYPFEMSPSFLKHLGFTGRRGVPEPLVLPPPRPPPSILPGALVPFREGVVACGGRGLSSACAGCCGAPCFQTQGRSCKYRCACVRHPSRVCSSPLRSCQYSDCSLHAGLLPSLPPLLAYESFSVRTRVPIIPCVSGLLLNTTSFSAALAAGVPVLGGMGGRWEKCIDEL